MIPVHSGSIINISSQFAVPPRGARAAYVSSKAGAIGLTRALAIEWAPLGLRVNSVAPGPTWTADLDRLGPEIQTDILAPIPLQRFAEVDDVALACVYLGSDAASYITGQVLSVDGGWTVW